MMQLVVDAPPVLDAAAPAAASLCDAHRIPEDRSTWHPLVRSLYEYWLSISPDGRLPGRQHVSPEAIAPLWSRLWLLDVHRNPLRYRYRLCGGTLVRSLGRELTGHWLDEVHPEVANDSQSTERLRFTAETGLPTWRRGPSRWTRNPDHRTVESCIVALAADGRIVDKMLGVAVMFDRNGRLI